MLLSVESVFPERAVISVCIIIIFIVDILKCISVEFFFLSFKPKRVSFKISLVTPYHSIL